MPSDINLLDIVFREKKGTQGLKLFPNKYLRQLQLQEGQSGNIEIYCFKRKRWLRARPEEVIRQLFLLWIPEILQYQLDQIEVEWSIQIGSDAEKERADIVIFSDPARTDPYIVFELKKPGSAEGLEQLRAYLRWTGCFFGCWSNGDDAIYQLREEDSQTKKAPYTFRDIPRLPKKGEYLSDILRPLTFEDLRPISDMRALVERLQHDVLANAGVSAFDELSKLFFAKLHDELRPKRKRQEALEFRVPIGAPEAVYERFNNLFIAAKARPTMEQIFDPGDTLKLQGDALRLCAAALEPFSLLKTDLDVIDAAFEYLVNPEQKGQMGQYFTPRPIVKMAVKMLSPKDGELVIDPACGSGGFLIHTLRYVQEQDGLQEAEIYRYANECLYGIDFDSKLVKVGKMSMLIAGDGKANTFHVNSLDVREWQNSIIAKRVGSFGRNHKNGKFDIVLTNPPFAGKISGKAKLSVYDLYQIALRGGFSNSEDEEENVGKRQVASMKRDVLFLERSLDLLKPGGRMAIVLPQGNLNNIGAEGFRSYMGRRARILAVVGLDYFTFRPFASIKTSVLFLQKWGGAAGDPIDDYDVFMAVSRKAGKDSRGNYVYKTDASGNLVDANGESILISNQPPAIDHDLDQIAEEFVNWGRSEGLNFILD
jgi:type I restriction enzyme M protein